VIMPITDKVDLVGYLLAMGIERRAIGLWFDALLKRALVLNYDPTCVDEATATRIEISPTGELHLFWGSSDYDYLFAMADRAKIGASRGAAGRTSRRSIGRRVGLRPDDHHIGENKELSTS
jgi:hypothetical protein